MMKPAIYAPAGFERERTRVHEYLSRELTYDWILIQDRAAIPLDACCVVLCGKTAREPAKARCLAFAVMDRGRYRWYGITAAHHEPEELYGVTGFVPVAECAPILFG